MQQLVDIWHDAIWHQTTISIPIMSIFHTAVGVVSQTAVYEKNCKVYWIEVWKKVMKT